MVVFSIVYPSSDLVGAEADDNYYYECKDVLLLFARGSGQNELSSSPRNVYNEAFGRAEKESYSFFNWFRNHLISEYPNIDYKAVSVHDFPGKYDPVGYKAVPVGLSWFTNPEIHNTMNAELSWIPGEYRLSVEHGIAETVGYLKDQIANCPDQSIVVGGYSQGAQVMGEALFQLTEQEREQIVSAGLFGDPKYIGSSKGLLLPTWEDTISFPWRRGDATNYDTGMLDPRFPYLPPGLDRRTVSYCTKMDPICAGLTGIPGFFTDGHTNYSNEPMRSAVNEMMQWAAPKLAAAERRHGGLSVDEPLPPTPAQLAKTRDVMFLLNDDSNDTVLQTFRYGIDQVLWPITQQYPNTYLGAKAFGEGESSGQSLPRVNNVQALLPYMGYDPNNPGTTLSNFARSIATRYPFGQPQMGGGDFPDPHGLAVERSALSGGWRPEAEKHIILITDRAPKENHSYNICNATVRSWLQIPNTNGYEACYSKFGTDIWPKVQHPEVCETIYKVITQEECTNPIPAPGYAHYINRTLNDGIIMAQSQDIAVSVVVPYKIVQTYNYPGPDKMVNDLKYLAESTGGKFIYYDQRSKYDLVMLNDTLQQVFAHTPTPLVIMHKKALDGDTEFKRGTLRAAANQPIILDVSQSNAHFAEYKWDFNNDGVWDQTTPGPVVETRFSQPYNGFAKVLGVNTDGKTAQGSIPVTITAAQPEEQTVLPTVPTVTAITNADGTITLTWEPALSGRLMVVEPESHLPIGAGLLADGTLTITAAQSYSSLQIYVADNDAISEPQSIAVQPYVPPAPDQEPDEEETPPAKEEPSDEETSDPTEEVPITEDPTLCYKLQTCHTGSNPEQPIILSANTTTIQAPTPAAPTIATTASLAVTTTTPLGDTPQVEAATTTASENFASPGGSEQIPPMPTGSNQSNPSRWSYILAGVIAVAAVLGIFKLLYKPDQRTN